MNFFWEKGPLFVREIVNLYDEPRPHFNTISTMVRNLEQKGFVSHDVIGAGYRYYAVLTEEEFGEKTLKKVIGKYFDNSIFNAVSTLVKEENISENELKELLKMVENNNKQNKK